jgi:hypothetical protein
MAWLQIMRCDNCRRDVHSENDVPPEHWYRVTRGPGRRWDLCGRACAADFLDPLGPRRQDRWGTDAPEPGGPPGEGE